MSLADRIRARAQHPAARTGRTGRLDREDEHVAVAREVQEQVLGCLEAADALNDAIDRAEQAADTFVGVDP